MRFETEANYVPGTKQYGVRAVDWCGRRQLGFVVGEHLNEVRIRKRVDVRKINAVMFKYCLIV